MSELVMRKMDGKNKLFKKTVKKCDDKEEKGEKHDSAKEEKAEDKEHKEHSEFPKKVTDQIAHDHIKEGKEEGKKESGGVRHGKKAKKMSFAAHSAKKWEKK
jgi:hypothetical protein